MPPLASTLGWPGARFGGVSGSLARENAMRHPARTASTAAALMIGLALVTAVGVLASGIKATFEQAVDQQFLGDYALTSENGFTPTGVASEQAVRGVPGVLVVSGVRAGEGKVFGSHVDVTGVEPNVGRVIKITWKSGGPGVPAALGDDGAFVSSTYAKDHHLVMGSPIPLELPTGETVPLKVRGIFKAPSGGSPFGNVTISTSLFDRIYQEPQNVFAFINMAGGVTPREHGRPHLRPAGVPRREDPDRVGVQEAAGGRHQRVPEPALRVALAVDPRQPVRHREHARPVGLRANP